MNIFLAILIWIGLLVEGLVLLGLFALSVLYIIDLFLENMDESNPGMALFLPLAGMAWCIVFIPFTITVMAGVKRGLIPFV